MKIDKTKNYLVIYDDNWADEMDISGFFTIDGDSLADAKNQFVHTKTKLKFVLEQMKNCILIMVKISGKH